MEMSHVVHTGRHFISAELCSEADCRLHTITPMNSDRQIDGKYNYITVYTYAEYFFLLSPAVDSDLTQEF